MSVPVVAASEDERKSNIDTVRSVEDARTVCPSGVTTRSSIGRSATVWINHRTLGASYTGRKGRTIVSVHTPSSTSDDRTVESKPQLYARLLDPGQKSASDTRAVWDLSTVAGALRLPRPCSASLPILRHFCGRELGQIWVQLRLRRGWWCPKSQ